MAFSCSHGGRGRVQMQIFLELPWIGGGYFCWYEEMTPEGEGKLVVNACQDRFEIRFESLDGAFRLVASLVAWWYQFKLYLLLVRFSIHTCMEREAWSKSRDRQAGVSSGVRRNTCL